MFHPSVYHEIGGILYKLGVYNKSNQPLCDYIDGTDFNGYPYMKELFDQLKYLSTFELINTHAAVCTYMWVFSAECNMLKILESSPMLMEWFIRSQGVPVHHPFTNELIKLVKNDGHTRLSFVQCYCSVLYSLTMKSNFYLKFVK